MKLNHLIADFAEAVGKGQISIYNEFSLQHELGIFLRAHLSDCRVEFERNISDFQLNKESFQKKEIDIAVTSFSGERLNVIELKYPRNGRVPESMFDFCKDIAFLERLVSSGFKSAYFLAFVDQKTFYTGKNVEGIYGLFRSRVPITGKISKPCEPRNCDVTITGSYTADWFPVCGNTKYCLVQVKSTEIDEVFSENEASNFRMESSGEFAYDPTEVRWKELPRKKLLGHPMEFAGLTVRLADGREIRLSQMSQKFIYANHLHPALNHPARIVADAIKEAKGALSRGDEQPLVLPPTLFESNHPMHVSESDPDLGDNGKALSLPRVQVIAEFISYSPAFESSESFSSLVVIWFQDNFGEIPSSIRAQLAAIEWKHLAFDWTP